MLFVSEDQSTHLEGFGARLEWFLGPYQDMEDLGAQLESFLGPHLDMVGLGAQPGGFLSLSLTWGT